MALINDIADIVGKAAPLLGKVIPGSEWVMEIVSDVFGAKDEKDLLDKLKNDPQATLKLQEIQTTAKVQLQQIAANLAVKQLENEQNMYGYEVDDRKDSRNHKDWITGALAILFTAAFIYFQWIAINTSGTNDDMIATRLGDIELFIISFYFGSSRGSRLKDMKK